MARRAFHDWFIACQVPVGRRPRRSVHNSLPRRTLRFEPLEDRRLLTITVNTLVDENDGTGVGDISLRDAIAAAAPNETIDFDVDLTNGGPATILLTQGQLVIDKPLSINGLGADLLTIDASGNDLDPAEFGSGTRIFDVNDGVSGNLLDVSISGLRLTGGDELGSGGAIRSHENLTLVDSVITGNKGGRGGGLYNRYGTMELLRTVVSYNEGPTNGHLGSGITNWLGVLHVTDSLVTKNGLQICSCGSPVGGAGIFNSAGSATVTGSIVSENSGGGIYSSGLNGPANVTIVGTTISGNFEGFLGRSAVSLNDTLSYITDSQIIDNEGRGVFNRLNSLTISGTTISSNIDDDGAGIYNIAGDLSISQTTISGNTANGTGGGLYHAEGNLTISDSTISGNVAGAEGGGLRIRTSPYGAETLRIANSTISGNSVDGTGGGIWVWVFAGDGLEVAHSTITGNIADADDTMGGSGGGMFVFASYGSADLDHSIVAGNLRGGGGRDDIEGSLTSYYSLIGDDTGAIITDNGGSLIGSGGVPIDPRLAPLADNGGPTQTHALLFGSPAIDAGNPLAEAGSGDVPEFDQRGTPFTRVFDGNGDTVDVIDIGAYESDKLFLVVDTLEDENDGDFSSGDFSLREAIGVANLVLSGSPVVMFAESLTSGGPATLQLLLGQLEIAGPMTIDGPGAALLTIDAGQASRVLVVDDPVGEQLSDVTIEGLTLTGGYDANGGGAIYSQERLTVADCVITGNQAQWGGGIYNAPYGALTVERSTISGNDAISPIPEAIGSGGGLYNWGGSVTVLDSTITGNSSVSHGGGLLNANNGTMMIVRSTVSGNTAEENGGGLINGAGDVTVFSSTLSGNHANGYGGGLFIATPSNFTTTISNATVSGNIAPLGGAGIAVDAGHAVIEFSTITDNNSNDFAGGGVRANVFTEVGSSIIAGNHHTDAASTHPFDFQSNGYNLIGVFGLGGIFTQDGDQIIGTDDPGLGPLADNGGPTLTHALLAGSPAIDAGNPNLTAGTAGVPTYDQRGIGFDRIRDGNAAESIAIDIGAFEVQQFTPGPALPGDYNHDDVVDAADYTVWRDTFGQSVVQFAGADGDGDELIDPDDYDVWVAHFGESLMMSGGGSSSAAAALAAETPAEPAAVDAAVDGTHVGAWATPASPAPGGGSGATAVRAKSTPSAAAPHYDPLLAWLAAQPRNRTSTDEAAPLECARDAEGTVARSLAVALDLAFASLGE